jgi:hypothetical protein
MAAIFGEVVLPPNPARVAASGDPAAPLRRTTSRSGELMKLSESDAICSDSRSVMNSAIVA